MKTLPDKSKIATDVNADGSQIIADASGAGTDPVIKLDPALLEMVLQSIFSAVPQRGV